MKFFKIHSVAKFQKIGDFEKFRKQKLRNFNGSLIAPKDLKKGTLWDFSTFVLLQDIKDKGGPFVDIKNFLKKKQKMRILNSLIVPKILKKGPFEIFNIRSVAKYQKKIKEDSLGEI